MADAVPSLRDIEELLRLPFFLRVESEVGRGSTFRFTLPVGWSVDFYRFPSGNGSDPRLITGQRFIQLRPGLYPRWRGSGHGSPAPSD